MPPVSRPPDSVYECGLLRSLKEKAPKEDGAFALVTALIENTAPLLDTIVAGPFERYTLHNRGHAKKLLHLADTILPSKTIERLSVVEHLVVIYSAFVHDLGLALSSAERTEIIQSSEFADTVRSWPELQAALNDARRKLLHTEEAARFQVEAEIFQLQEAALSAYVRPRHATPERYKDLISTLKRSAMRDDLFSYRGVDFEDWLIDICVSHNLPANILAEAKGPYEERYPRDVLVGGDRLNTQFCAVVLRLTDILDFDRERTPRVLFESLGVSYASVPGSEVSLQEWQKHMAVHTISVDAEEIVVAGDCHHPVIEKAVREFCLAIEHEIRDSLAVLRRNAPETVGHYFLDLPIAVRPRIRSIGYVFKDMSLQLNQSAIASLLMGERLYSNRSVAIRELLQNAIDACGARRQLEPGEYIPRITVTDSVDPSDRHWIEVSDNGIGMDEHVLSHYFLTLGNSFYDSPEFRRLSGRQTDERGDFIPIARFGIGVASVFMLADLLEVQTRTLHSVFNDSSARTVRIERMGTLAFVTESHEGPSGTKIRLRVRPELNDRYEAVADSMNAYIANVVTRPAIPIETRIGGTRLVFPTTKTFVLNPSAEEKTKRSGLLPVLINLEKFSSVISGEVVLFFCEQLDGKLSYRWRDGSPIQMGKNLSPEKLYENYTGNQVALNGFRMSVKKMAKVLGFGKKERVPMILDINVRADAEIGYDVARDQVTTNGRFQIAYELRQALLRAVAEKDLIERLEPDTKAMLEKIVQAPIKEFLRARGYLDISERELAQKIVELVPSRIWRKGMEKGIAERLCVPTVVVISVVKALLDDGQLTRSHEEATS